LLLLRLLALFCSLFSRRVCRLGGLEPPTVHPRIHFSFSLSRLMALCYTIHGLCDHVRDVHPPQLVVLMAGVPLLLSLLHPPHDYQPLCFLVGCPGFDQVGNMSNRSVLLRQFLCLLSYRPLHAAPPVPGGPWGLTPPSPFSVLISLHQLKYGSSRSLRGDGGRCRRHLHRHIHRCVAPPISSFSRIQVTPAAHSEFGHYFFQASLLVLLVLGVARSLADRSCPSRFLPNLYANPLRCVDSCARPPPVVSLVLGRSLLGQFDV